MSSAFNLPKEHQDDLIKKFMDLTQEQKLELLYMAYVADKPGMDTRCVILNILTDSLNYENKEKDLAESFKGRSMESMSTVFARYIDSF